MVIDGERASLGGGAARDGQSENDTEEASCSINYYLCSTKNMFFEIIIWSPQSVVYMCTLKQFHHIVFNGGEGEEHMSLTRTGMVKSNLAKQNILFLFFLGGGGGGGSLLDPFFKFFIYNRD